MSEQAQKIWGECLEYVRNRVPAQTYDTWFAPMRAISVDENNLFLQVPNKFFYDWIESHYKPLLEKAVTEVTGNGLNVKYTVLLSDEVRAKDDGPEASYSNAV